MHPTIVALAIVPLLASGSASAASTASAPKAKAPSSKASPTAEPSSEARAWDLRPVVWTKAGARLSVGVTVSKVQDREVVVLINKGGISDHMDPLAATLHKMGSTVVSFELPDKGASDALHAMISWSSKRFGTRVNVFGVGAGADLALAVGSRRTKDLWSIMLDGVSPRALAEHAPRLGDADAKFEGLLTFVEEEGSAALSQSLASDAVPRDVYVGGPRLASDREALASSVYRARIERFLFDARPIPDLGDCTKCGPDEAEGPRRVVVLDA